MGKAGCGKDTVADYLVARHSFVKFRLAQAIEDLCRDEYGMKEKNRELMIRVGEAYKKKYGQDYWLRIVASRLGKPGIGRVVVSDVRFPYEYEYFDANGFIPVRIVCSSRRRIARLANRDGNPQLAALTDPTEQQVDDLPSGYQIDNSGTLQELYDEVDILVELMAGREGLF
ncbi:MAG: hypothetical protein K6U80_18890 [Firmicutes bacterium]|nr:hypothetical protein [Bacillota bacterium]